MCYCLLICISSYVIRIYFLNTICVWKNFYLIPMRRKSMRSVFNLRMEKFLIPTWHKCILSILNLRMKKLFLILTWHNCILSIFKLRMKKFLIPTWYYCILFNIQFAYEKIRLMAKSVNLYSYFRILRFKNYGLLAIPISSTVIFCIIIC